MSAGKPSNFFTLLSYPVCEHCGYSFNWDKHYWMFRRSKRKQPGPTVDGLRSHITSTEIHCNRCDRWWNIQVLWVERWAGRDEPWRYNGPPPHDGLQIFSCETPEQALERILDARRGRPPQITLSTAVGQMTESDAVRTRRHIAELRKMLE